MEEKFKDQIAGIFAILLFIGYLLIPIPKEEEENNVMEEVIEEIPAITVTATVYHPVEKECDSDPLVTADNSKINMKDLKNGRIKWIAVSRDLLCDFSYGDSVRISGHPDIDGIYEIHDTMNKRWTKRIDILAYPSKTLGQGKWEGIFIEKL